MNLCRESKSVQPVLSYGNINLLVLTSEWSKYKVDFYHKTDVILVLLQGVQAQNDPSVFTIQQSLNDIDIQLEKRYLSRMRAIADDVSCFMSLFETFSGLFAVGKDGQRQAVILDRDYKNSVLSVFVRRCVQEYQRLTFSQVSRLHSGWSSTFHTKNRHIDSTSLTVDQSLPQNSASLQTSIHHDFSTSLQRMMVQEEDGKPRMSDDAELEDINDKQLGVEALQLAQLHGKFGHKEEGVFALQESIRLAQQRNNSLLLEYALGWLHKLQPMDMQEALIILARLTKNAEDLKLPILGMWGRLQLAKTLLTFGQDHKRVLEVLLSSESDFSSVYTDNVKKLSQRSSVLALQGATWSKYGHKLAGVFYSQLLCHMTDCCDLPCDQEKEESFALCLCSIAKHLFRIGKYGKCETLLRSAQNYLKDSKIPFKLLCQCEEETCFDRALQLKDFSLAKLHLNNLVTFSTISAEYRSALLANEEGDHQRAFQKAETLIKSLSECDGADFLPDCYLLLADILSKKKAPSMALPHIMTCLSYCEENHLPTHAARLSLAQIQLQLGASVECLELVEGCLLQYYTHGCLPDIATAYFLQAQSMLMLMTKCKLELNKEDALKVVPFLEVSVDLYLQSSLSSQLKQARTMQACLLNIVGSLLERDCMSKLVVESD